MSVCVTPTQATLGAVVTEVQLASMSDNDWAEIHDAFLEHAVLIFPAQHLDAAAQLAFAERFGEIEILVENLKTIPISNKAQDGTLIGDRSDHMLLLKGNEGWHTDSSYMPLAAKASVLSAHVVPSRGGETEWADMRAAFDALDSVMREKIKDLTAHHSYFYSQAKIGHKVAVGAAYGFFEGEPPLRPLLKQHPETGRWALFIGRHACDIPGMTRADSEALLDDLTRLACQPPARINPPLATRWTS